MFLFVKMNWIFLEIKIEFGYKIIFMLYKYQNVDVYEILILIKERIFEN